MRTFLALVGIACMLLGVGSCALGGAGGLAGALAASAMGAILFGAGLVALGLASVLEELQAIRRHFERHGKPAGTPADSAKKEPQPYREI